MRFLILLCVLAPVSLLAQDNINVSFSNYLRYGTGKDGFLNQKRDYFENLGEARITFSDFLVGFRLLHDAPPEFGVEFSGLKKRYVEFKRDDLYVRGGDSFTLFGRGAALNLFENRPLAFDTGLDGIKMEYKTRMLSFAVTAGDIRYHDVLDLTRVELYRLRGGSLEIIPYPFFSVGVNFVNGTFRLDRLFDDKRSQFDIPELFVRSQFYDVDLYLSYAEKRTTQYDPDIIFGRLPTHRGTAAYGSIAYTAESFGVSAEYKDYRFGIATPYDRFDVNRSAKAFAFQNPPIVHKEHAYTLLTRYPHIIDFNDEVGFQVDAFYTIFGQLTGSINGAMASRHYSFTPTGDTNQIFLPVYASKARDNSFLPSTAREFSPFWEIYADWQYFLEEGGNDYIAVGVNRRSDTITDELLSTPEKVTAKATRSTSIPVAAQVTLPGEWVVKCESQSQWVWDEQNSVDPKLYNQLFSLGLSKSPVYSVTVRYEYTTDKATVDGRKNWTALDIGFRLSPKHNITLTAGGDRGGTICANGVCRVVNPFIGFRASITSYL